MRRLPDDEAHVYWLDCHAAIGDAWLDLLSSDEIDRYRRFVFEKDRRLFLLAHGMTRVVLGRYTGRDPKSLVFQTNEYGKPRLVDGGLGFNLSHTHGMAALAVAHEPDIGVDVEDTTRASGWESLAPTVFTPEEMADLQSQERFYERWTLKEAYIKARGMGLSLPLRSFAVRMDDPEWQFELLAIGSFRIAVAVRRRGRSWKIQFHRLPNSL